jgi:DNA-binding beta-propeller fold protein YncE
MKSMWIVLLLSAAVASGAVAPNVAPLGSYAQSVQTPARAATDAAGNVYVTDSAAGRVTVFDAFGRVAAVREGFAGPLGIAVDAAGQIYLGEEQTGSVSAFDSSWNLLYQFGAGTNEFQLPNYITLDPPSNTVYVSDGPANAIKVYSGGTLVNQFGSPGTGNGQFDFCAGICVSTNGEVFVVDQGNDRAEVFSRAGTYLRKFKLYTDMFGPQGRKHGLLVDNAGRLYVADTFQGHVKVYDAASGTLLSTLGSFGTDTGQLMAPAGLALDLWGRLCVASANNGRLELFGLDSFVHLSCSPAGNVIAAGSNMVFTATTGGAGPFTFQWFKDGVAISGETNATLSVGNSGGYSVVMNEFTSSVAQVTVLAPPSILSDPQSATVLRGTNVQFTVSTAGSALTYQWQWNGQTIEGATNSMLSLENVQGTDSGPYAVVVQNAVGSVVSAPATLTVLLPPWVMEILSFNLQPDLPPVLTFNADPGLTYQIEVSSNMTSWTPAISFIHDGGIADFMDADATNQVQRFYRLRWVP